MPPDIIQTQKELAREKHPVDDFHGHHIISPEDLDRVVATIITNIGRELEAQLKEKSYIPWDHYHDTEGDKAYIDLENAVTIIRSITGISPTR